MYGYLNPIVNLQFYVLLLALKFSSRKLLFWIWVANTFYFVQKFILCLNWLFVSVGLWTVLDRSRSHYSVSRNLIILPQGHRDLHHISRPLNALLFFSLLHTLHQSLTFFSILKSFHFYVFDVWLISAIPLNIRSKHCDIILDLLASLDKFCYLFYSLVFLI